MSVKKQTGPFGLKEIAECANVSMATVDRVIHNRTGVSNKTRDKINAIIQEKGYQPNLLARRLASKKILQFATVTPKISDETAYWDLLIEGIDQAELEVKQYGVQIIKYFFDQNDKKSFDEQTELILKDKPDGILIAPIFIEESIRLTQFCQEQNIPVVYINSDIPNQNSLCYIGPDLYHSGYLAAHLVNFLLTDNIEVLIVNISKELENHHYTLRKEEGFRQYFTDHAISNKIIKTEIRQTDYSSIEKSISHLLSNNTNVKIIFVTNSRVSTVASYLERSGKKDILLIGYDFLPNNIEYLKNGTIHFLICQKPREQLYRGVMSLFQYIVHSIQVENVYFMPIDIITKENYIFYHN